MLGGIAFLVWSTALSVYDLRHRRLPDWLTLPAVLCVWVTALATGHGWGIVGGVGWFLLCVLPVHLSPRLRAGGGDAKLALSLGCIAMISGQLVGLLTAVFFASLITLTLLAIPAVRERGTGRLPHGPGMLIATAGTVTPVITAGWW